MPRKLSRDAVKAETDRLFKIFKSGRHSVRKLAKINGLSFSTLRDRFRRAYGDDYAMRRCAEGTIAAVLGEHLRSMSNRDKHRTEVTAWWRANRDRIETLSYEDRLKQAELKDDEDFTKSAQPEVYTESKITRDTHSLCRLPHDLSASPFLRADERYEPRIDDEEIELVWKPGEGLVPANTATCAQQDTSNHFTPED